MTAVTPDVSFEQHLRWAGIPADVPVTAKAMAATTAAKVTPATVCVVTALVSWQAGIRQSRRSSMIRTHSYDVTVAWTGNRGSGTSGYREYGRDHEVTVSGAGDGAGDAGRPQPIAGSSDSAFRGDPGRWNPEQLLTAALAQCHMLSYLHACAAAGIVVTEYTDEAHGTMTETTDGGGHFIEVVLRPRVTVASPDMVQKAAGLHREAHEKCFIASSVNFPVRHEPVVLAASTAGRRG
jgi:organic hydroperoxide reductase OsmC/OhrA